MVRTMAVQKGMYGVKIGLSEMKHPDEVEKQYDIVHKRMLRASLKCEVFVCNEAVEIEVGAISSPKWPEWACSR